jgi:glycosyltransferase involved in cell wall biosynthesis
MQSEFGLAKTFLSLSGIISGGWRIKNINHFISVSSYVFDRTQEKFPSLRNQVIPNFLNPDQFREESNAATISFELPKKYFLYIGVLSNFKGVPDIIEGFKIAWDQSPELHDNHLLIMGPENPASSFKSIPHKNIQVITFPPRADVVKAIFSCQALIVPSRCPDACPTVILEGLSALKPVIGTDVGGIPDLLAGVKNTFVIPPNSPKTIADLFVSLNSEDSVGLQPEFPTRYLPLAPTEVVEAIVDIYQAASKSGN